MGRILCLPLAWSSYSYNQNIWRAPLLRKVSWEQDQPTECISSHLSQLSRDTVSFSLLVSCLQFQKCSCWPGNSIDLSVEKAPWDLFIFVGICEMLNLSFRSSRLSRGDKNLTLIAAVVAPLAADRASAASLGLSSFFCSTFSQLILWSG